MTGENDDEVGVGGCSRVGEGPGGVVEVAGVSVHVVAMAAEGAAARSVRACRPGRCPAAVLLRETLAGLGPGVLRPVDSRAASPAICGGGHCSCSR